MDKILEYFIKEPEREFCIRELARLIKRSPTTISKFLSKYKKELLLLSREKFNHLLYKADIKNPKFKDLKLYYNVKRIRESGLIDFLVKEFNHPEAIVLFGSFRKAENIPKSDVDILIVTPLKKQVNLKKFEKNLDHNIQLFLHSNQEINRMKNRNKNLLNNFVNGIILYGFWEVFK